MEGMRAEFGRISKLFLISKLTAFAFALLYQVLVLYIVVATLAKEPGPAKKDESWDILKL